MGFNTPESRAEPGDSCPLAVAACVQALFLRTSDAMQLGSSKLVDRLTGALSAGPTSRHLLSRLCLCTSTQRKATANYAWSEQFCAIHGLSF